MAEEHAERIVRRGGGEGDRWTGDLDGQVGGEQAQEHEEIDEGSRPCNEQLDEELHPQRGAGRIVSADAVHPR